MTYVKGTYAVVLHLDKDSVISVGKLGSFDFRCGYYLYVGSALNSLCPRIERHIRGSERLHWHIDFLRREADVAEVWYMVSEERLECRWYEVVSQMPGANVPVNGFGSSGCRCPSHLIFCFSMPSFDDFSHRLGDDGENLKRINMVMNSGDFQD